jgi:NTE family protein
VSRRNFWTWAGKHTLPGVTQGEGEAISLSPAGKMLANWAGHFSPSQLNPFDLNPFRDQLERQIDFKRLRRRSPFKLFIGTTQANTGKLRVFRESELTVDVLLASACLPSIHHSVLIDGEPYWDGGYSANPAVFPLCSAPTPSCLHTARFSNCCGARGASVPLPGSRTIRMASDDDRLST